MRKIYFTKHFNEENIPLLYDVLKAITILSLERNYKNQFFTYIIVTGEVKLFLSFSIMTHDKGGSRLKNWCMARVLSFLIRYFNNYYTLHRSDLAALAAPLDPRLHENVQTHMNK